MICERMNERQHAPPVRSCARDAGAPARVYPWAPGPVKDAVVEAAVALYEWRRHPCVQRFGDERRASIDIAVDDLRGVIGLGSRTGTTRAPVAPTPGGQSPDARQRDSSRFAESPRRPH